MLALNWAHVNNIFPFYLLHLPTRTFIDSTFQKKKKKGAKFPPPFKPARREIVNYTPFLYATINVLFRSGDLDSLTVLLGALLRFG